MKIKEFAQPVKREETIQPEESYEVLGIRLNGNGLYVRERKKGSEIATNTLNKVQEGDFIYSRLFGWRGAFGIVPEKFDGLYVSNEFPTFEIDESKVNKEFLLRYFLLPKTLHEVESYCIGTTKQSRNRFKEPYFLDMEVEFPRIEEQDRLNDRLANTENHVFQIKSKGEENERLIKQLRQSILQEAIQGKLTKEWRKTNPDAESADQLLARIQKEKERLIREKQIKKEKPLPPVTEEEKPFELPEGWVWCRLGQIVKVSSGDGLSSEKMNKSGDIPVFGGNGIIGYHNTFNVEEPTIVIGRVGSCGSVHLTESKSWITDNAFITYFSKENINQEFLVWLLKATNFKENVSSTAQPVISGRKIYPIMVPLPPHEEQEEIVEKVKQLMTYCDELEAQVKQAQTHAEQLMEAVLQEVFEGNAQKKPELT